MKTFFFVLVFFIAGVVPVCSAKNFDPPLQAVVRVPLADVRAKPILRSPVYEYDDLQETQVLKGEPVLVYERKGQWARVECPDQMEYTHSDRWQGYPGWVQWKALTKDLSLYEAPARLSILEPELRAKIIEKASLHLDSAYLWGGRSLYDPYVKDVLSGVDCSGLINWSFRQVGWLVPRDAHEQYMRARPIEAKDLKPADLIFLAKEDKPEKIVHVAFFLDSETLLEAPQSGERVRKISFKDRFGKTAAELKQGDKVGDRIIYFGTLLGAGL